MFFLKSQLKHFCTVTGIKAFGFALNSRSRLELALWIFALISASVVTVLDTCETVRTYYSAPTLTKLTLTSERPFNLSYLTICQQYDSSEWKTLDFHIKMESEFQEILLNTYVANYMESLHTKVPNQLSLMDQKSLIVTLKFFSELMKPENMKLYLMAKSKFDQNSKNFTRNYSLNRTLHSFNRRTLADFATKVGKLLWCSANFTVTVLQGNSITEAFNCDKMKVSWIGPQPEGFEENMCLSVNSELLSYNSVSIILEFSIKHDEFYQKIFSSTKMPIIFTSDPCMNYEAKKGISLTRNEATRVVFRIDGIYKSLNKEENPCSNETVFECMIRCSTQAFIDHCHCLPIFSIFYATHKWPYQSLCAIDNEICNVSAGTIRICRQSCKHRCVETILSMIVGKDGSLENETRLALLLDTFVHPAFMETYAITPRQFLAQLGGNLSFWIGANFLVILHIIVYIIRMPFSYFMNVPSDHEMS